jgi:mono/diheme cytochrome c family protein
MAATDQNYRNQKILDIVFAVSCVLMLASIVWMFVQDYNREFKKVQREFRDVDEALTERTMLEKLPEAPGVESASQAVKDARKNLEDVKTDTDRNIKGLLTQKDLQDAAAQGIKADYDSYMSLLNQAVDQRDEAPTESRRRELEAEVARWQARVAEKEKALAGKQKELESTETQLKKEQARENEARKKLADAEANLKKIAGDFDRFAKATAQKKWKIGDTIRNLPVLDAFASPTRIQQFTLAEYPIDYNFKYVTRYDRCTTCHLGIDQPAFRKDVLRRLAEAPEGLQAKLEEAHRLIGEQQKDGFNVGFDPNDLPRRVRTTELTAAQISEYCVHPRLDLFVDANSPHPAEKFGCTSCHAGQGSATDFLLAAHTPNSAEQREQWIDHYGWESSHFWDYPMLSRRFVESTCLKCHHQVTDLVRYGSKEEAPKLIKGYNLVRESGCFGCHEIAGLKNGRAIGPDMRLEPSPPLEAYTPAERAKLLSDPQNQPGTMRKVGPSLYRLSEKTNQQWVRKWIEAPRDFRPTTRMPHFYGLSNNRKDVLPEEQKDFPDAEISSIAYYLLSESKDYLKGMDKYRHANLDRIKELEDKKARKDATEKELQQLEEMKRRLELDAPPVPLADNHIIDSEGQVVSLPPARSGAALNDQIKNGRKLFTERGCLACHSNSATARADATGLPSVSGQAAFGPDLSRLAAKIAPEGHENDPNARRRWLVQWVLDPKVHFPRTRMPITHLTLEQADDIATWLLSQQVTDWKLENVPEPGSEALASLARVYLLKAPGITHSDADSILGPSKEQPGSRQGLEESRVHNLPLDTDEHELRGPLDDHKLMWYIGRKAISRMGCFGCHEIPGFATAKPIGTPLNDWGKKDPERLAFEDIVAYVGDNYHIVDQITDGQGHGQANEDGKKPYDKYFFEALEHHNREGFLHQKLVEPRSYDFDRVRTWDDRLRMPQFQFAAAPITPKEGETPEQAKNREEAEGREAVMTFILGLVAEQVPSKYLYAPAGDRLAEVKGRKVLEKFNCIGCHQVRSGVYEVIQNDADTQAARDFSSRLEDAYGRAMNSNITATDHVFPEHNAWTGLPSPHPDRLIVYGLPSPPPQQEIDYYIRLTQALRFTRSEKDQPKEVRNIPAGEYVDLSKKEIVSDSEPYGGEFANLMVRSKYLTQLDSQSYPSLPNGESPESRKALPPPLLREGEKTRPEWLFQFLRNPTQIRPVTILRMPRFSLSDEEAMDLVNYFGAVDHLNNPGIGLTYPYVPPAPQQQEAFWQAQSRSYVSRLTGQNKLTQRLDDLKPLWDFLYSERLAQAEAAVKAARDAETKQKDADGKKAAAQARQQAEKELADLKDRATFDRKQQAVWESDQAYASDAYRLLANYKRCLNCHAVGPQPPTQPIGPPLELAAARLRPDYTERWIASPQRLLIYPDGLHAMPPNFPGNGQPWADFAADNTLQQATAVRDVLINYPKIANLPVNRYYRSASSGENK